MKTRILTLLTATSITLASCGGAEKEHTTKEKTTGTEITAETYTADTKESEVNWKGEVAGVYGHTGFVNLQSGSITLEGEKIKSGEFVVDMTAIIPTDSASYQDEEGHRITDLQGHLTTVDFFNTADFPTSTFTITSVEGTTVTGDLTIRGKTHEEKIELESTIVTEEKATIKGKLVFNRQNYDVAWVHYMKDMILSDDITINYTLVATK